MTADHAAFDIKAARALSDGFRGRFFCDHERGDFGFIAKDCDDHQCDCARNINEDGDQDCALSLSEEIEPHVAEPIAEMLNAYPTLLDRVEALEDGLREACNWIADLSSEDSRLVLRLRAIVSQENPT